MNIINRLHNCPNCGGTLQDDGACRFCGSRVYDFVGINLDNYWGSPTYIRVKFHEKIIIMPVIFNTFDIEFSYGEFSTGTIEFVAVGDTIVEDTKITGSEY